MESGGHSRRDRWRVRTPIRDKLRDYGCDVWPWPSGGDPSRKQNTTKPTDDAKNITLGGGLPRMQSCRGALSGKYYSAHE